jgi:hypothetical protein
LPWIDVNTGALSARAMAAIDSGAAELTAPPPQKMTVRLAEVNRLSASATAAGSGCLVSISGIAIETDSARSSSTSSGNSTATGSGR